MINKFLKKAVFIAVMALFLVGCKNTNKKNINTSSPAEQEQPSKNIVIDEERFYDFSPYFVDKEQNDYRTSFVSISDSYVEYLQKNNVAEAENTLLNPADIGKDTIKIEGKIREKLLARTGISEEDKLFIFDFHSKKVLEFAIKNLPTIAAMSIYDQDSGDYSEGSYQLGFDLGKLKFSDDINSGGESLTYIGKENPFKAENIRRLSFKELPKPLLTPSEKAVHKAEYVNSPPTNLNIEKTFQATDHLYQYVIQDYNYERDEVIYKLRYVAVLDKNQKVMREFFVYDSMGGDGFAEPNDEYYPIWTGEILHGKSPVLLGLDNNACDAIFFLNETDKEIWTKCDNRH